METISHIPHYPSIVHKRKQRIPLFFISIYNVYRFILRFIKESVSYPFEGKEVVRQCYEIGCKSLPIISLTAFITGIVFTKQSRPSLASFGASSWLPGLIAIAIVRALAPLITALIIAGKVGSNMGAELGSMKVTEQIDAMEVSSTNPFKFLVVTRIMAITIMLPLLAGYFAFIGLLGAYLNVHANEQTSYILFMHHAFSSLSFIDLFGSILKSFVFGATIGVTGCFKGFYASHGTVGVGRAANAAVVISMFLVFIEEMFIVQIINYFR
ncbi:MlaE family ABC transporter permease [Flavisolibacter tropicus]|uniref:ABC transporter permease n=1 Tax=Flavisolibacter tropicus TaxID=1492898 RepID=A0A172TS43_9BACT|nr:ABC transporter permease [Flavisolibacter tropicus]ANE49583.1 ABC transporter permease [Flavisolibacter tropicus]